MLLKAKGAYNLDSDTCNGRMWTSPVLIFVLALHCNGHTSLVSYSSPRRGSNLNAMCEIQKKLGRLWSKSRFRKALFAITALTILMLFGAIVYAVAVESTPETITPTVTPSSDSDPSDASASSSASCDQSYRYCYIEIPVRDYNDEDWQDPGGFEPSNCNNEEFMFSSVVCLNATCQRSLFEKSNAHCGSGACSGAQFALSSVFCEWDACVSAHFGHCTCCDGEGCPPELYNCSAGTKALCEKEVVGVSCRDLGLHLCYNDPCQVGGSSPTESPKNPTLPPEDDDEACSGWECASLQSTVYTSAIALVLECILILVMIYSSRRTSPENSTTTIGSDPLKNKSLKEDLTKQKNTATDRKSPTVHFKSDEENALAAAVERSIIEAEAGESSDNLKGDIFISSSDDEPKKHSTNDNKPEQAGPRVCGRSNEEYKNVDMTRD